MQRSEMKKTDVEIIGALMDIIGIVLAGHNEPIREDFKRQSRSAQVGYDVTRYLFTQGFILPGEKKDQIELKEEDLCQDQ